MGVVGTLVGRKRPTFTQLGKGCAIVTAMEERPRAYQASDGSGFVFNSDRFKGFADNTTFPRQVRRQVAVWAVARGVASDEQKRLAGLPIDEPVRAKLAEFAEREDDFLDSALFEQVVAHMPKDVRTRILRPEGYLDRALVWPLGPADVERLFPQISSKQLRDWDSEELVTAHRWGEGNYRGYFRSQLVLVYLVDQLLRAGWTIERVKEAAGLTTSAQRAVVADLQAVVVERRQLQLV